MYLSFSIACCNLIVILFLCNCHAGLIKKGFSSTKHSFSTEWSPATLMATLMALLSVVDDIGDLLFFLSILSSSTERHSFRWFKQFSPLLCISFHCDIRMDLNGSGRHWDHEVKTSYSFFVGLSVTPDWSRSREKTHWYENSSSPASERKSCVQESL